MKYGKIIGRILAKGLFVALALWLKTLYGFEDTVIIMLAIIFVTIPIQDDKHP
jgi:hypothetical protein